MQYTFLFQIIGSIISVNRQYCSRTFLLDISFSLNPCVSPTRSSVQRRGTTKEPVCCASKALWTEKGLSAKCDDTDTVLTRTVRQSRSAKEISASGVAAPASAKSPWVSGVQHLIVLLWVHLPARPLQKHGLPCNHAPRPCARPTHTGSSRNCPPACGQEPKTLLGCWMILGTVL